MLIKEELLKRAINAKESMYRIALGILKNYEDAEDAVQEAMIKIWKKAGTYNFSLGKPETWFMAIVKHTALDILKYESHRKHIPLSEINKNNNEISALENRGKLNPLEIVVLGESNEAILEQIANMEKQDMALIILSDNYSYLEMSALLKKPMGTIKSRLHVLRKKLSEYLP